MALFFKANAAVSAEEPSESFTRFNRWYVRDEPSPNVDRGIDPHKNLTRSDRRHIRAVPSGSDYAAPVKKPTDLRRIDVAAHLHATDAISIDVLRRALPLRSSKK